ncbi:alpha/beta hydrolase [Gluconacetobacter entanii]|uniref:Alpha/beta hydrolase n=1 Tax=Gluconacetobacter entanii TaxID=108528 RepID=A0ABT3K4B5_9PROT|nr:alpha/beta fold hydrolase [Gluconacetobacter entanii]MCW4590253.1 alpha/beta hydrolase [Gluconacetobacter entanii]MCW4594274.1 alpha/beta hydrolase [Gluconacetobacter entanii]
MTQPSLTHAMAQIGDVRLHYVRAGQGEPVLLVHGWPQTWYEWHRVIPHLVKAGHEVIAVDMRGAGDSSRPASGYDSNTVADELHALVRQLGFASIAWWRTITARGWPMPMPPVIRPRSRVWCSSKARSSA